MDPLKWFSICVIFLVAFLGGYYPLAKREISRSARGFPAGESFTAGVFLALSLFIMLPAGLHLFSNSFPDIDYPLAAIFVTAAFLLLLALEHISTKLREKENNASGISGPVIPMIMTVMIAIPSFFWARRSG